MQNILIILFAENGFDRSAQGLLGAGQNLAKEMNGSLIAVVIGANGESISNQLTQFADQVLLLNQPELAEYQTETYLEALVQLFGLTTPFAYLLANDTYSQEIAPRLAHRLRGSAVGDGIKLQIADEKLRVTRQAYGGKALSVIELKKNPAVVWLRARTFPVAAAHEISGKIETLQLSPATDSKTKIIERNREETSNVRLEDARIIVSGGRGLGGAEQFLELQKLVEVLNAQMAASRAACDAGWVSPTLQVGQTGKKVAPDLYLAVGISGASQHLAGMSDSKVIAAINTDPNAPILKHCQFGIVEDYKKVLPLLVEKLYELKK